MTNEEALADFRRRWEHSYVWLKMQQKSCETLVLVRQVERDERKVGVLHLESADYGAITINLGSPDHSLSFRYPQSGVFQHGAFAAMFRRIPARQWKRGICTDNSYLDTTVRRVTGTRVALGLDSLKSAFEHKTYTKDEALEILNQRKARSVALRDNFSISLSPTVNKDHLLLFWDNVIGRCDSEGKVTVFDDPFAADVNEVMK